MNVKRIVLSRTRNYKYLNIYNYNRTYSFISDSLQPSGGSRKIFMRVLGE